MYAKYYIIIMFYFQLIRLNSKGQLGVGERCVEADGLGVKLVFCRQGTVDGPWQYDEVFHLIFKNIFISL